jgi:hypothetical protein
MRLSLSSELIHIIELCLTDRAKAADEDTSWKREAEADLAEFRLEVAHARATATEGDLL